MKLSIVGLIAIGLLVGACDTAAQSTNTASADGSVVQLHASAIGAEVRTGDSTAGGVSAATPGGW